MTVRVLLLSAWLVVLAAVSPSVLALTSEQALAIAAGENDSRIEALNAAVARGDERLAAFVQAMLDDEVKVAGNKVFIGEIKGDGQFNVVWKTPGPVKAQPWSPFIPENKGKKDEPEKK